MGKEFGFLKIQSSCGQKNFLDIITSQAFLHFYHGKCIHGSPGDALKCQSVIAEIKIQSLDFRRAVGQIMLSEKGFELIFC